MGTVNNSKRLVDPEIIRALRNIAPGCTSCDVPLDQMSWYKIGGKADVLIEPDMQHMAAAIIKYLKTYNILYTVIGSTSNILFDDAGYRGVLIKIADNNFTHIKIDDDAAVQVGAGVWVPFYVRNLINKGIGECVHAVGIPGSLGGLIMMNGGSLRKGIGEQLLDVTIVDSDGNIRILKQEECAFGYRASALQKMDCIILEARFQYKGGENISTVRREALDLLVSRSQKFPRKYPSCGSVFLSYPEMYEIVGPPGKAIEDLGFKGKTVGGAQISPVHANFIINKGGAKAWDVLNLIHQCRQRIMDKSGFDMRCEVRFLPADGSLCPAHLQADAVFKTV
ncbi:MAG: UDP-N-acetylmuramate dehydrogenase [Alphaproteobacteria bacterium]